MEDNFLSHHDIAIANLPRFDFQIFFVFWVTPRWALGANIENYAVAEVVLTAAP
jgi:hypothetical protein